MGSRVARFGVETFRGIATLVSAVVLAGWVLPGCAAGMPSPAPAQPAGSPTGTTDEPAAVDVAVDAARACAVRALGVLDGWDRARAAAYADGDARRLRRLYVPGSRAADRDVATLREYAARGLVITGMRRQVLDAGHCHGTARRLRVVVTDRLAGGRVVGAGDLRRLPATAAQRWRLTFVSHGHRWLLARVVRR